VEAHIFVAFLAYALSVTLKQRLTALAPGLTPRAVLEKLATIQMLDVCLPTTDGRWLIMPRTTQPEPEQSLMLHQLHLSLPSQPPPRIKAPEPDSATAVELEMQCRPWRSLCRKQTTCGSPAPSTAKVGLGLKKGTYVHFVDSLHFHKKYRELVQRQYMYMLGNRAWKDI